MIFVVDKKIFHKSNILDVIHRLPQDIKDNQLKVDSPREDISHHLLIMDYDTRDDIDLRVKRGAIFEFRYPEQSHLLFELLFLFGLKRNNE